MQNEQKNLQEDKMKKPEFKPARWQIFSAARFAADGDKEAQSSSALKPARWQLFHAAKAGGRQTDAWSNEGRTDNEEASQ